MLVVRNRHQKLGSKLRVALFVIAGVLALLTLGLGTALAEGEEEGGPIDPVVVPEVEVPPVTNPTPVEPTTPVTSAPAPVVKAPESAPSSSGGSRTSSPSTGTRGSSGGSKSTPTQTNNGLTGSGGSSDSGRTNSGGSSGGGSTTSAPTGSSSPLTTTTDQSTSSIEKAAAQLAQGAGNAPGGDKKSKQQAVKDLGEAVGKALLGNGVSVAKSKPQDDGVADFVPLPGKSKTVYFLLILVILAIASFVIWTQFRGPRASRRRKAHIDHRVASADRLSPAERVRARQWSTEHARRARTARRKAA